MGGANSSRGNQCRDSHGADGESLDGYAAALSRPRAHNNRGLLHVEQRWCQHMAQPLCPFVPRRAPLLRLGFGRVVSLPLHARTARLLVPTARIVTHEGRRYTGPRMTARWHTYVAAHSREESARMEKVSLANRTR